MTYPANIYLDTHAVIWLENGELYKFGCLSLDYLANCHLLISPIVKLELQYLHQIKRLNENSDTIIGNIAKKVSFSVCKKSWIDVVNVAIDCHFSRDVFDRLIVAHAMLDGDFLISKDHKIYEFYVKTIW